MLHLLHTIIYPLISLSLLLLHPLPALAVSVSLDYAPSDTPTHRRVGPQTCRNLRPGRCCQSRPIPASAINPFFVPPPDEDYRVAQWTNLGALDIAAVWRRDPSTISTTGAEGEGGGCKGTPIATQVGPGAWRYPASGLAGVIVTGASYIRLPQGGELKDEDSPWLEAEGILGLVTGGGEWISKGAGASARSRIASWRALLYGGISRMGKRGVFRGEKGLVLSQPPLEGNFVWVDLVMVDGVEYEAIGEGSPVYRSQAGAELNLTHVAP
ncbi:MAG: hypothetical protein Q9207_006989 [Kuettlingeria erythrocarpa]